jgi:hypothetical protein
MSQRVIIEGDLVKWEESTVRRQVSLPNFIEMLKNDRTVQLPRLPRNTRFFHQSGNQVWIIIELDPGLRFFKTEDHKVGLKLSMPWQYFAFSFIQNSNSAYPALVWQTQDYHLFWSPVRIRTLQDRVTPAFLPNIYRRDSGRICFGNTTPDSTIELAERVDTIVNEFFSPASLFNQDLEWNLPPAYESFRAWAIASRNNALVSLKWPVWESYNWGRSLSEYMVVPEGYNRLEAINIQGANDVIPEKKPVDPNDPALAGLDEEECQCDECVAERGQSVPAIPVVPEEEIEDIEEDQEEYHEDEEEEEEEEELAFEPEYDENGNPL